MQELDIEHIDKSSFVCYQLKDDSLYYGEVIYQSADGKYLDPKTEPDAASKGKPLRHGFGIQITGTSSEDFQCKYQGYWDKDRQHGACHCWYTDKAIYEGNMKYNTKEGQGKYVWANGDEYDGTWRNNRFEGTGTFTHHSGNVLNGVFKNNYFMKTNSLFVNPFLSEEEIQAFIERKNAIDLAKENNKKHTLFFFEKTSNPDDVAGLIKKSNANKRIPLIMSSHQLGAHYKEVFDRVKTATKRNWYDFDLRQVYLMKKTNQDKYKQLMIQTKKNLSNVLAKGETFLLNLDDSASGNYEDVFYPDIREFYSCECLPSEIWNMEHLNRKQVYERVLSNTDNNPKSPLAQDYSIAVWSKYTIDETFDNKKIIEKIERRFSSIIPMAKIDLIILMQ